MIKIDNLISALKTLKIGFELFQNNRNPHIKDMLADSCVKRFEYTYETAKKIMNKFLKKEYDKTEKDLTINNIFREMYSLDLIKSFDNWAEYREKRNYTSHEYDDRYTYEILELTPHLIEDVDYLIHKLDGILTND